MIPKSTTRVLVVDDEAPLMQAICVSLEARGYAPTGFTVASEALDALRRESFDAILTDLMMPVMDGISVVEAALEIDPNLAAIIMTGHGSIDTAVIALQSGAVDYILKPFKLSEFVPVLARALRMRQLRMENLQLREMVNLHECSVAIALAQDPERVLNRVAEATLAQTDAAAVWVLMAEESDDAGAHTTVLRVAATGGKVAYTTDDIEITDAMRNWAAAGAGSEMAAPLADALPAGRTIPMMAGGRLEGLIHWQPAGHPAHPTPGQMRAMHILAGTAGSALAALSALNQLRTAEARYRLLVEEAPDVVCHFEIQPRRAMTYVNPAVFAITGYTPEEFYADPDLMLRMIHPEDREAAGQIWRGEEPGSGLVTLRWITKKGSGVWVEQRSRLLRGPGGAVAAVEVVSRDVTERKTLEERLRHSQRLEAMGTLTAGIAHDFNNLLTVINGFSALAARDQQTGSLAWSRIREVQQAGKQAAAITAQLLAFGRKQVLRPRPVNLGDVIAGFGHMIRSTAGPSVEVILPEVLADCWVKVDPVQIQQVVLNLAANARDAMEGRGRLEFGLSLQAADAACTAALGIPAGDYVRLTVSDTGSGIAAEIVERVFEPFFTTKELGRGTGLGLATVHGIMEQSGGHIRIQNTSSQGTTFALWFPPVRGGSRARHPRTPGDLARGRDGSLSRGYGSGPPLQ